MVENRVIITINNYLYRIRCLDDFIKTDSRINSDYSGKRQEVDSSDHIPLCSCQLGCGCQVRGLQLQMQLHRQTYTWAGWPFLPGWRRKAGQGASWNKALLLLKAVFTHNATYTTCSHNKHSGKACLVQIQMKWCWCLGVRSRVTLKC